MTMNPKVTKVFKDIQKGIAKHTPEILTGVGVAGMITTTVLAVKATPKAVQLIEAKKKEEKKDKLTVLETVKTCWKPYIPAVVTGITSTACLIGSCSVSTRRNAALATAYQLSSTALSEYREKVVETIGEKKEKVVKDAIAKEKVEKNPVSKSEVFITEKGNSLILDALSGRYFKGDIDKIQRSVNELNRRMISDNYISLNDFYSEIGLKHIDIGDDLGWNTDDGFIDLEISTQLADDNTPCAVISFDVAPRYGYERFA